MAFDRRQLDLMTYEELEKANHELRAQRVAIREQQLLVHAEMQKKAAQLKATAKYAAMSPAQKAALSQVLTAKGIPSTEHAGKS